MNVPPPAEFDLLGLDREHFIRASSKNYRGPCPRCGGSRRFVIFNDKPFPKWNFYCEGCGWEGWADDLNSAVKQPISDDKKREWVEKRKVEEQAREKYRRERLSEFTSRELWLELAARMDDANRAWWRSQGIPDEWQKALRIGYTADKHYLGQDGAFHSSPAYTIPYFHTGFEFVTLQYRLNDCTNPAERYRFEKGLGTSYYMTTPNAAIGEQAIICEGAKKGIVTAVNTPECYTVLAVPSKSDFGGVVGAVRDCERVYVILDPDAGLRAHKLAAEIGPAARIVQLPTKVDDGFTCYGLTQKAFTNVLRYARVL